MNIRKSPKQEYSQFRDYVEALSEKTRILRNRFYNHAFNDGTLRKVVEVRSVIGELIVSLSAMTLKTQYFKRRTEIMHRFLPRNLN